jgi:hypothetical protein
MAKIVPGRFTADIEGSFVVFVIGMRINKLLYFWKWIPVITAMQAMITELYKNKELGFLDMKFFISWRGITLLQYWRSFDHLERYARNGAKHLEAWRNFNKKVASTGEVGFYHETYIVQKGQYECMYVNMPVYGLARASNHVPATGRRETARGRLGKVDDPANPPVNV